MSADDFYWYASIIIFVPWVLLIAAPRWKFTEPIAFGSAILLLLAAAYFTFDYLRDSTVEGSLISLDGLTNLFRSKAMLLTGWLNYLSFCLLVGTWQSHDARQENLPHVLVIPCLILTLITGPAGLLLYLIFRFFKTKDWKIN